MHKLTDPLGVMSVENNFVSPARCFFFFIHFLSQIHEHPSENNPDVYYWVEKMGTTYTNI